MNYYQRIKQFLNYKDVTVQSFERACGLSNGSTKKVKHTPRADTLEKILRTYPELSRTWLMCGKGEMLISGAEEEYLSPVSDEHKSRTEAVQPDLTAILKGHAEERARLEEIIRMCNEENKRLIDTIDALNLTLRGLMTNQNR